MPSEPNKRNKSSTSGSPTITSSSLGAIPNRNTAQAMPGGYGPAAIESWMKGVANQHHQPSNKDPAVQAYLAAKMGLFQHLPATNHK